jgi:hypothetical protein
MKKHRFLVVAAIAIFLIYGGWLWLTHDLSSVDAHGLAAEPPPVPADHNAYLALNEATNGWTRSPEWVGTWCVTGSNWNPQAAADVVASNSLILAGVERALELDQYRSPVVRSFDDQIPWLAPCRDMGRLLRVKSQWQLEQGDAKAAADSAVAGVRLGHLMQVGNACLIEWLVGIAVKASGYDQVRSVGLAMDKPEAVLELMARVEPYASGEAGLDGAMGGEYRVMSDIVRRFSEGLMPLSSLTGSVAPDGRFVRMLRRVAASRQPLALQTNRTMQDFADYYAELSAGRELPLREALAQPVYQAWQTRFKALEDHPVRQLLRRNPLEIVLAGLLLPSLDTVRSRASRTEFKASAVRVVLACHAFRLRTGQFPARLEQLVPEYLSALPRDPYDGAPSLRYDAEKKMIYTVGENFKDDGVEAEKEAGSYCVMGLE